VKRLKIIFSLLAILFPLAIYILTASRTVYGVDSGDFLAAAWVFGVAHSPGYPLYTLLLALWARIPFGLDPIFQMNLTSAIFHSLTIGIVFLILYKLTKTYLLSLISCLILAFTYLFWTYSLVVEAFALNDLFAAFLILVALYFYEAVQKRKFKSAEKLLLLFLFLFSLSFTHHQTIVLLIPAFLYLFFASDFHKKITKLLVAKGLVASFFGLLPYLYLPIAASFNPPINWGNPTTIGNFLMMVFRTQFGTFSATSVASQHLGFGRLIQAGLYLDFLQADFLYLGLAIAFLGAIWLFVKNRQLFWFFILGFLISGPAFIVYANFPTDKLFTLEVSQRFVLLSYLFFVVFLAFGFIAVKVILNKFFSLVLRNQSLSNVTCQLSIVLFALSYLLFTLMANYQKTDLSKKDLGDNLAHDVLITPQGPATLSLEDDTAYFTTLGVNTVKKIRPDVLLVMGGAMNHPYYVGLLKKNYPNFSFPSEDKNNEKTYFLRFLEANLEKFATFTFETKFKVEGGQWMRIGILSQLYPEDKKFSDDEFDKMEEGTWLKYRNTTQLLTQTSGNLTFEHIVGLYAGAHADVAEEYVNRHNLEKAKKHLMEALELKPSLAFTHFVYAQVLFEEKKCQPAIDEYAKAYELEKGFLESFIQRARVAEECLKDKALANQYLVEYNKLLKQSRSF